MKLNMNQNMKFIVFLFSFFILCIIIVFIGSSRPTIIKVPEYDYRNERNIYDPYYNKYD